MKHNRIAMMAFILIQLFAGASHLKGLHEAEGIHAAGSGGGQSGSAS